LNIATVVLAIRIIPQ